MKLNKAGLDLIKEFEGLRLQAYKDGGGVWTIGYGTTAQAGVGIAPKAGMTITEAQAETSNSCVGPTTIIGGPSPDAPL